jgi:hypothetical protein
MRGNFHSLGFSLLLLLTFGCAVEPLASSSTMEPMSDKAVIATKTGIHRALEGKLKEMKACFQQALDKNPKLSGKLVIAWTIDDAGHGKQCRLIEEDPNLKGAELSTCICGMLETIKFEPAEKGTTFEVSRYPLVFIDDSAPRR